MRNVTLAIPFILATQAGEAYAQQPEIPIPGLASRIDASLSQGCPDPTPGLNTPSLKACADAIWGASYTVASEVSGYIKNHPSGGLLGSLNDGRAQGYLLACEKRASAMSKTAFSAPKTYAEDAIATASFCIRQTDYAEGAYGAFIDTRAQNIVIDAINCFRDPNGCKREEAKDYDAPASLPELAQLSF
ncbi:MAG: hypothetical protein GW778_02945 [Alphaproteobacteria bacterium]|nr:hypothetical protein [Alphaproteobacteria bacterium]